MLLAIHYTEQAINNDQSVFIYAFGKNDCVLHDEITASFLLNFSFFGIRDYFCGDFFT